jgi:hypothetical protein
MEKKEKIASEKDFRIAILKTAKKHGFLYDMQQIFARYDNLLKNCTNQQERKAIGIMGIAEAHKLMHCKGALIVEGQEVIPADPDFKEEKEETV